MCGTVDKPKEESPEELELRRKIQKIREGLFTDTMEDGSEALNSET